MSKIFFLCTTGLVFLNSILHAQIYSTHSTPILRKIIETEGGITVIHQYQPNKFLEIEDPDIHDKFRPQQTLIKNDSGLFITLSGTGNVYRMISADTEFLHFSRIDRTVFSGYNFNAINFSHKNRLTSLGGYGFWRTNGHLRYFTANMDWQLIPVSTELGTQSEIYGLFPQKDQIFYLSPSYFMEAEGKRKIDVVLAVRLELNKGENKILGDVNGIELPPVFINLESLQGTLVKQSDGLYLLSWQENKKYKVMDDDKFRFINTLPAVIFEYNDSLIFSDYLNTEIKKISINRKDFKITSDGPIYNDTSKVTFAKESFIFLCIGLAGIITAGYFFKKKKSIGQNNMDQNEAGPLEENHINLLYFLQDCNKQGTPVTTEAINSLLGFEKKPVDIQKRIRRDSLNKINLTFKALYKTENPLIIRIRSKDDKRYFTYHADDHLLTDFLLRLKEFKR